ncbi:MAG: serine/threonine-protein kinase [Candidatus Promineifilaceae bacterium]
MDQSQGQEKEAPLPETPSGDFAEYTGDEATQILDFAPRPDDEATQVIRPVFDAVQRPDHRREQFNPIQRGVTRLGDFQLLQLLGIGGFSWVFLARQRGEAIDRQVVVKVLKRSVNAAAFKAEADTLAKLGDHPRIIQIHDARTTQGRDKDGYWYAYPWLAMQYAPGKTLKEWYTAYHAQAQMPPLEPLADILEQVAEALDYAHERGRIHRDIKPANILFDERGQVLLSDFGIAMDVSRGSSGSPYESASTPPYMSPEQVLNQTVDRRLDIYALGVVLFEILSGTLPYVADSVVALQYQIAYEPVPEIRDSVRQVPRPVARVIRRAMAKDPDDRYASAGELARAFRSAIHARRRAIVAGLAALAVLFVVVAFAITALASRSISQEVESEATKGAVAVNVQQTESAITRQHFGAQVATITAEFEEGDRAAATSTASALQAELAATQTWVALPRPAPGIYIINRAGFSTLTQDYQGSWACTIERYLSVDRVEVEGDGDIILYISQWIRNGEWDRDRWDAFPCPYSKDTDAGRRNMFLADGDGNQIFYEEVGGAAGEVMNMADGVKVEGWLRFTAPPPGHTTFDFHVSDEGYVIEDIDLAG